MQDFFSEYGKVILILVVIVALIGVVTLFMGTDGAISKQLSTFVTSLAGKVTL